MELDFEITFYAQHMHRGEKLFYLSSYFTSAKQFMKTKKWISIQYREFFPSYYFRLMVDRQDGLIVNISR